MLTKLGVSKGQELVTTITDPDTVGQGTLDTSEDLVHRLTGCRKYPALEHTVSGAVLREQKGNIPLIAHPKSARAGNDPHAQYIDG